MRWICTWQREIHIWRSEKYSLSLRALTPALCWCPMDHIFTPFHHPLLHGTVSLLLLRLFNFVNICAHSPQYYVTYGLVVTVGHTSLWPMGVCAVYERSSIAQVSEEVQFVWVLAPLWEVRQKGPKLKTSFQPRKTSPTCFFSSQPPEDIIPSRLLQLKIKA